MKRCLIVSAGLIGIYATLSLAACASLPGYFSPKLQADAILVTADVNAVNGDLLKIKADYAANKAALPADMAQLVAYTTKGRADLATWTADLKAAGQPPPVTPAALAPPPV